MNNHKTALQFTAHDINTHIIYPHTQVIDANGDTWTYTLNSRNERVWALGDYDQGAPIYEATQLPRLSNSLEPYEYWDEHDMPYALQLRAIIDEPQTATSGINPKHYQGFSNGAEVIDITENLTFNTGNAVKYLARAGRTDGNNKGEILEDLQKAQWYVQREIARLEEQN